MAGCGLTLTMGLKYEIIETVFKQSGTRLKVGFGSGTVSLETK